MRTKILTIAAATLGALIGPACGGSTTDGGGAGGDGGNGGSGNNGAGGTGLGSYEYGMPYARYVVSGSVVDELGNGIEGIELTLGQGQTSGTADSAPDGSWNMDAQGSFCHPDCSVSAEDVDGPAHGGQFESKTVPITLEQTVPGSGWDEGTWEAHGVTIELEQQPGTGGHAANSGHGGAGGAGLAGSG